MIDSKLLGRMGEESAAAFLCGKGFKILHRNYISNHHETDIIAEKDSLIVFCEVKTRSEYPGAVHRYGRPACAVNRTKQKNLCAAVNEYIKNNSIAPETRVRIDIIEVYTLPESDKYKVLKIVHMENAVHP